MLKKLKYAALLSALVCAQSAFATSGAIFTSTGDGAVTNENVGYPSKAHVYLNGGPQNLSSSGLTPGTYYFQVTTPSNDLLSEDDAVCRKVTVGADGRFAGYLPDVACTTAGHANGTANPANGGGVPVQLIPYADTTNSGGEYKVWLIDASCPGLTLNGAFINFRGGCSKTDNFKVDEAVPTCPDGSPVPENGICPGALCPDGVTPVPENGICPGDLCPDGSPVPENGICFQQRTFVDIIISGQKYLDANADGALTEGEVPIQGVEVSMVVGQDVYSFITDEAGRWSRTFTFETDPLTGEVLPNQGYPLSFTVCEEPMGSVTGNWLQTGPNENDLSSGGTSTASATRCWVGSTTLNDSGLNFGNVCWGVPGGGGFTKGFWSNKNGAKTINNGSCLPGVLALPLRNPDGTFLGSPPLATFQKWLTSSNASNMASQLSAQLAAMWLNVNCKQTVSGTDLVYAPDLTAFGVANSAGVASIDAIITAARAELAANGIAISGGTGTEFRAYQEALKTALDRGNNNLNWVGDASSCVAPEDWVIITPVVNVQ